MEEKCVKLIFAISRSAKVTCGLGHEALKTIYTEGILPLMLNGPPVWKSVLNWSCYKAKINRIQRHINLRFVRAYRTVSNEALCVINGITQIHIKIDEIGRVYEITQGMGTQYDRHGTGKLDSSGDTHQNNRRGRRKLTPYSSLYRR